jgi:hypothetical protein
VPAACRQHTAAETTRYARLPRDAFWGSGAGHQVLLVVPSLDLIAVRNGENLSGTDEHHDALNAHLFEPLLDALAPTPGAPPPGSAPPYPPASALRLQWAAKETIVRRAAGSDNWPLTWADDDHLYTAYGDGHGFDPPAPGETSSFPAKWMGADGKALYLVFSGDDCFSVRRADVRALKSE